MAEQAQTSPTIVFLNYLRVVEELYEKFVLEYGAQHTGPYRIHSSGIPSRQNAIEFLLNNSDLLLVVEATLVAAANILSGKFGYQYAIVASTYSISKEKCALYWPAYPHGTGVRDVQVLIHSGESSIATIMAEDYVRREMPKEGSKTKGNPFEKPGTKIPMGDYGDIADFATQLCNVPPHEWPFRAAFVLSGKHNSDFQDQRPSSSQDWLRWGNLADEDFFREVSEAQILKAARDAGVRGLDRLARVPGTVLLARKENMDTYPEAFQWLVDSWYKHALRPDRRELFKSWGFEVAPWTTLEARLGAIAFTEFVIKSFGDKKCEGPLRLDHFSSLFPYKAQLNDLPRNAEKALAQFGITDAMEDLQKVLALYAEIDSRLAAIARPTAISATPEESNQAGVSSPPEALRQYLTSWRDIMAVLNHPNTKEERGRIRKISKDTNGPIIFSGRGAQPKTEKRKLIEWWNGLEQLWQRRREDSQQRRDDAEATVAAQHPYGRNGIAIPGISGGVRKRRTHQKG